MKGNLTSKIVVCTVLFMFTWACNVPVWVNTVQSDVQAAAPIAASVVAVIDPSLSPIAALVVTGIDALSAVLNTYKSSPNTTNLQAVDAAVNAVNANVQKLMNAARVLNQATQARVVAVVGLLSQLVNEIVSQIPSSNAKAMRGAAPTAHGGAYWKQQYNSIIQGDPQFAPIK